MVERVKRAHVEQREADGVKRTDGVKSRAIEGGLDCFRKSNVS